MRYVLIGNSTAATFALEGIRAVDREGSVVIVSKEERPAYGRPLISYVLGGKISPERAAYRPADFYERMNAEVLLGDPAIRLDPAAREVHLASGKVLPYDKLLVATGSHPAIPPIKGLETVEKKFTFMTMEDALALGREAAGKRVLVVGAGLIGLKCAEGLTGTAKSITVADLCDRVLPNVLDAPAAAIVRRVAEAHGVSFRLGDGTERFEGNTAYFKSGARTEFDLAVIAAGVRPATELVREAGGATDRGILVNERQETSLPDVYAAGDVCESFDICTKRSRVLAILPNAAMQGDCAGRNMAGGKASFLNAMPVNAVGLFGSHIVTAGAYEGESYTEGEGDRYKRLFYADNALRGFILVNCIEGAGIYTSLLRDGVPLDEVDFERLKHGPSLAAFPRLVRERKLTRRQ